MILVVMLTAFCASASAESDPLSVEYVPRTTRGTLFYLDISCVLPVSAAVFELQFDSERVEYRSVHCEDNNASAIATADDSALRIAYSSRNAAKGTLYRLAFKAIRAGETDFTLRISQAVDGDLRYLQSIPAYTLSVKLGKDDVIAGSTAITDKSTQSAEKSKKTYSGSKSTVTPEEGRTTDAATDETGEGIYRDLSGADNVSYLLLGGATVILAGLLAAAGIFIGRRMKKKPKDTTEDSDQDTEEPDLDEFNKDTIPEIPEPSLEESFKDIE